MASLSVFDCPECSIRSFFFFFFKVFVYCWLCWVFVAAGLLCSCGERGLPSSCGAQVSRRGGLSLRAQALGHARFSSCGSPARLLRGMWDLPTPGIEPVSPALAGGFFTSEPPGKPAYVLYTTWNSNISHPRTGSRN